MICKCYLLCLVCKINENLDISFYLSKRKCFGYKDCCFTFLLSYTCSHIDTQSFGSFILQEQLPNDLARVDTLFQKAREAGVSIQV